MPRCPRCQSEYGDGTVYCPKDGEPLLPMVLEGRYRLLSPLGAGGMGRVYLAEHVGLGKRVAVKVLRGELSRDAIFARRFELEAIAASQLGHENIVDVTDLGRTPGGELYYVMELLEGASLGSVLLRERYLPLARAVPVLAQVCRALEAAHARGIIHRDVKPQNVMLLMRAGRPDFVKVVDFGISKVSTPQGVKLTEVGAILGTADYMAPEQATGGDVAPSADVYSVGVLTYELCTGTLPFRGDNTFATMLQHVEATPEPPSRRRPELGLPPELDALVLAALAKNPAARPSMARFRAGLEALPVGPRPLLLTPEQAVPEAEGSEPSVPTRATRRPVAGRGVSEAASVDSDGFAPTRARQGPAAGSGTAEAEAVDSDGFAPLRSMQGSEGGSGTAEAALVGNGGFAPLRSMQGSVGGSGTAVDDAAFAPTVASARAVPARARSRRGWLMGAGAGVLLVATGVVWMSSVGTPASGVATREAGLSTSAPAPSPADTGATAPSAPADPTSASSSSATHGQFLLRSTPPGATVSARGQVLGVTPLEVDRATVGTGPLRVTLSGHEPLSVEHLPPGEHLDVTLKKQAPSPVRTPAPTRPPKVQDLKPNPF